MTNDVLDALKSLNRVTWFSIKKSNWFNVFSTTKFETACLKQLKGNWKIFWITLKPGGDPVHNHKKKQFQINCFKFHKFITRTKNM